MVASSLIDSPLSSRTFGVEQEHFVFHKDLSPPTHAEIDQLWERLKVSGYEPSARNQAGQILAVTRQTTFGPVVLSNDACTHILEASFPPFTSLRHFTDEYRDTWTQIDEVLNALNLFVNPGGALPNGIEQPLWRAKESDPEAVRLNAFLQRESLQNPLFYRAFPACFAATQVSLGLPDTEAVKNLEAYYSFEFLVPLFFSTSPRFLSVEAPCVRLLAWEQNFASDTPLLGIPDPLPTRLHEYDELRIRTALRDYSYVAIRSKERVEFRSACSQPDSPAVERLVRFRLAVDHAAREGRSGTWCARTALHNACWGKDVEALSEALEMLTPYLDRYGVELERLSTDANSPLESFNLKPASPY